MKPILLIAVMFFVANCANFELVYKSHKQIEELKDNTAFAIAGDESNEVYSYIINVLGSKNNANPNFKLSINSSRIDEAQVIEKDATASKFSITYTIVYNLYNTNKNCEILEKEIITKDFYDSKSAGYSFGTDLSKKETITKLISKNIDQFVSLIDRYDDLKKCSSEN